MTHATPTLTLPNDPSTSGSDAASPSLSVHFSSYKIYENIVVSVTKAAEHLDSGILAPFVLLSLL